MTEITSNQPTSARSKGFVIAMIALAALLFLSTVALLYYRWVTMHEPSCELTIDSTPALRGAVLKVDGPMLAKALQTTIGENDKYTHAFFLDPGDYEVTVTLSGQQQYITRFALPKLTKSSIDLTKIKPTTQPITGPLTPNS
jgi:hypothetical protein